MTLEQILKDMVELAAPRVLPTEYTRHCNNMWEAFRLGKLYQAKLINVFLKNDEQKDE